VVAPTNEPQGSATSRTALVLKATGSWYTVRILPLGDTITCRARGRIRLQGSRATNPIVVGDFVTVSSPPTPSGEVAYAVDSILPRKNYIVRRASNLSKESHIIAANLDLVALVVNLVAPPTPLEFIDRFLATAQAYGIPAIIVHSKCDVELEKEAAESVNLDAIYSTAGYPVLNSSINTNEGIDCLKQRIAGKTTLFAGMSGVGKSSLLNAIAPQLSLRTAPISSNSNRGRHTTTFCEAFELPFAENTFVIDSPGIKGFGVIDFQRDEVSHFFPEIFSVSARCRFPGCLHLHEPGCAVVQALDEGLIAPSRYNSYISILLDEGKKYR